LTELGDELAESKLAFFVCYITALLLNMRQLLLLTSEVRGWLGLKLFGL
jgi:hypothetical protein